MKLNEETQQLLKAALTGSGDALILQVLGVNKDDPKKTYSAISGYGDDVTAMAANLVETIANSLPNEAKKGFYKSIKKAAKGSK